MSELLVLGIGSPFGDDRLGWDVISLLQQRPRLLPYMPNTLSLQCCDRPGLRLLELIRNAKQVFLVDALKTNTTPGKVHRLCNDEITAQCNSLSSHEIGVAQALQLGKVLQQLPSEISLFAIAIKGDNLTFECSVTIDHAIKQLADQLEVEILNLLGSVAIR